MANIEMGDTPNITAAERFLFLSALGLGAPYEANEGVPYTDVDVELDYANGPVQKLTLFQDLAALQTITLVSADEGATLTLYIKMIDNAYNGVSITIEAALPSESLVAFPKVCAEGTYIAKLIVLPVVGWSLVSLVGAYQPLPS